MELQMVTTLSPPAWEYHRRKTARLQAHTHPSYQTPYLVHKMPLGRVLW